MSVSTVLLDFQTSSSCEVRAKPIAHLGIRAITYQQAHTICGIFRLAGYGNVVHDFQEHAVGVAGEIAVLPPFRHDYPVAKFQAPGWLHTSTKENRPTLQ